MMQPKRIGIMIEIGVDSRRGGGDGKRRARR